LLEAVVVQVTIHKVVPVAVQMDKVVSALHLQVEMVAEVVKPVVVLLVEDLLLDKLGHYFLVDNQQLLLVVAAVDIMAAAEVDKVL
jgi:hypothetical protein